MIDKSVGLQGSIERPSFRLAGSRALKSRRSRYHHTTHKLVRSPPGSSIVVLRSPCSTTAGAVRCVAFVAGSAKQSGEDEKARR